MKDKLPTGWEWKTLEDVCDKASSNISQNQLNNEIGEFSIFGASGLIKKISFYHQEKEYIGIVKDGAGVGRVTLLPKQSSVIGTLQYLIPKENVDIKFLFYFLKGLDFVKFISGNTIPHIYYKNYKNEPFPLPSKAEQQKIASCLSSLDEVIAGHSQKLETLKDHKKGLLQNLFPQEEEKVPKYRFPEFVKDGEWVEKVLYQVANYENGKALEKDIYEYGNFIVVNSKFISTEGEIIKYSNTAFCIAEKGDILIVLSDVPNGRAIAKCFYVNEENKYTVNQRICKITPFNCNNLFLYYIMNRNSYFLSFDDGVKQTNLRNDDVQNFSFLIPENKEEQKKIASCLSSLEALITVQTERIKQLKLHKKGLIQMLFPKIATL